MLRPIPDCPGPKLEPFEGVDEDGHISDIKFLKKIGEGLHSYTFKVDVGGAIYCLKVVRGTAPSPFSAPILLSAGPERAEEGNPANPGDAVYPVQVLHKPAEVGV
jgi:hypothetical protein